MIYFMQHNLSKPKRIRENYARDFYQMWFGNDEGTMMFNNGSNAWMPQCNREYRLWGEEISESGWFKKILQGGVEEGFVAFDGTIATTIESWASVGTV